MSSDLLDNNLKVPSYDGTKSSLSKHLEALYKWLRHKDAAYKSLVAKGHALSSRGKTTVSCTETARAIQDGTYSADGSWEQPKVRMAATATPLPD